MSERNPNYIEEPYSSELSEADTPRIAPPMPSVGKSRGATSGRRSASPWRKQLIVIAVDDSASMKREGKCVAATKAIQEVIVEAKMKSVGGQACFDVFLFHYGDHVFVDDQTSFVPVTEVDEDDIFYEGRSGGTRIKRATSFMETEVIRRYDKEHLAYHAEPLRVPPPLCFLLSDGYNGDGNPLPIAKRLKDTPLSIGIPPILVTIGIEYGGGEPHVELLSQMASRTTDGTPLYFDISDASQLVELLATSASSAASTADDLYLSVQSLLPRLTDQRKGA